MARAAFVRTRGRRIIMHELKPGTQRTRAAYIRTSLAVMMLFLGACAAPAASPGPAPTPSPAPPSGVSAPQNGVEANSTLTVYAAASLNGAFQELARAFQAANPGVTVEFNFAGSQELRAQIEQGARADVFASADLKNMDVLKDKDLVGAVQVFARNRLVVIVPRANPAGVLKLNDLASARVKLVIAGQSVPVGNYTYQLLDRLSADAGYGAGFKSAVLKNVVSYENNVKAVVSKVALGEADAGVVYATDAQAAAETVSRLEVPDRFNILALYPAAVVRDARNAALAQKWIDYLLSAPAQAILSQYGFIPPA